MNNIVALRPEKDPDYILQQGVGQYKDVLLLGYNKDGMLYPTASSDLTTAQIVLLIEQFKLNLLCGDYD